MVKDCIYHLRPEGCKNGDNCKFRHQEQDQELRTAAFFSATSKTEVPSKEKNPTTRSTNHDFNINSIEWLRPGEIRTDEPIKQEDPATTSNGTPPQDSSTAAPPSANNDRSLRDDGINGTLPSSSSANKASQEGLSTEKFPSKNSSKAASPSENTDGSPPDDGINVAVPSFSYSADKDSSREGVDAAEGKLPPIKQEYPATTSNGSLPSSSSTPAPSSANTDGFLLEDKINGTLPSSYSSADKASSREDVDPQIDNIDASASGTNGAIPATPTSMITSNDGSEPLQDSLTASSSSTSSRKDVDGPLQKGLSAETLPSEPKAMRGEEGEASTAASPPASPEWYPQDDEILPSSSSREDFEATVNCTLYGPKRKRLEVFETMFPE